MNELAGELSAIGAALGWTISAVCWTIAGHRVGSLVVNTVRLILSMPIFILFGLMVSGQWIPHQAPVHAWLWLSLSGVTGFFLCDMFLFKSLLVIGPRLSLLIFSLAPIVASVCGWAWLDERLTLRDMLGVSVALSGVIWVVLESPDKERRVRLLKNVFRPGIGLAILAMVTQGLSAVLSKHGMRDFEDPVAATQIRAMAGLICFLLLLWKMGKLRNCVEAMGDRKIFSVLLAGTFAGPTIGVALLMFALTRIPSGLALTFVSLTPVLILPFSHFLHKEQVSFRAMTGAGVACAGLGILLL